MNIGKWLLDFYDILHNIVDKLGTFFTTNISSVDTGSSFINNALQELLPNVSFGVFFGGIGLFALIIYSIFKV